MSFCDLFDLHLLEARNPKSPVHGARRFQLI